MCITRAKHINHSAFHHSPLACFRFWNDKQTETDQNKRLHQLHSYCTGFGCMHQQHTPHKRHLCVHAFGPLHFIFLVLTECHLYSGHVLHCVSPWSNSWRQLLALWLRPTPLFMTCMCQSCYMCAEQPCSAAPLCVQPCCLSLPSIIPRWPSLEVLTEEELAFLAYSPQGSTHKQTCRQLSHN